MAQLLKIDVFKTANTTPTAELRFPLNHPYRQIHATTLMFAAEVELMSGSENWAVCVNKGDARVWIEVVKDEHLPRAMKALEAAKLSFLAK